ncbi:hypothetical protein C3952_11065 [Lactococcus lactis]|nr:hypothetical protein C3952_11065 [Lactococcus lactis]
MTVFPFSKFERCVTEISLPAASSWEKPFDIRNSLKIIPIASSSSEYFFVFFIHFLDLYFI